MEGWNIDVIIRTDTNDDQIGILLRDQEGPREVVPVVHPGGYRSLAKMKLSLKKDAPCNQSPPVSCGHSVGVVIPDPSDVTRA